MAVRDDQKEQVQQATDLVRLIGEQVALRPKGREFAGLCPFHDDKNPSMFVSPAKQIYKCFSCGAGGDAFSFVMNYHKMTFPEALKYLAERAGIVLQTTSPRGGSAGDSAQGEAGRSDRQRIAAANAQAVEFYQALYRHSEHGKLAREYVAKRGISPEMVEAFQLGYAPDRWDGLALTVHSKNWDERGFELAGLISHRRGENADGSLYDRLRHRLIFPIFDAIGRPIAFGGRKLREEDEPKYLNSPETAIFNKSATLYGLNLAKKPIIDARTAVIVEGYTDVIACHQAGACNVVATLGTALTAEHVRELRRYADKVVLVFDADEAGQKAADRAVELFLTGELDVAIAVLPTGPGGAKMDPAELMSQPTGLEQFQAATTEARDALSYQFNRVRDQVENAGTVTAQQKIVEAYVNQLGQLGLSRLGGVRRALVVQRLAELLRMAEGQVSEMLSRAAARNTRPAPVAPARASEAAPGPESELDIAGSIPAPRLRALRSAERQIIGCLIRQNELFHHTLADGRTFDEAITPGDVVDRQNRRLFSLVHDCLAEGRSLSLAQLLGELAEAGEEPLTRLLTDADAEVDKAVGAASEGLAEVLNAAADALLAYHHEAQYERTRAALGADDTHGQSSPDQARLLRELIEHRRANPSPVRIARPRG